MTALEILQRAVADMGGTRREGQEHFTQDAERAFTDGAIHLAQAGTGTGKSLAYLAAAFARACEGETTVISTATLALQRQILLKDAPQIAQATAEVAKKDVSFALLKGWQNYVCLHKLEGGYPDDDNTFFQPAPTSHLAAQVLRLRQWAKETDTGDRDDLVPGVNDRAWRQVSIDKRACLGSSCPHLTDCFPATARDTAHGADVIITNHAVLGVSSTGAAVLPEHENLIIDEAHELISRLTSSAAQELNSAGVQRVAAVASRVSSNAGSDLIKAGAALSEALEPVPAGRLRAIPPALADAAILINSGARDANSTIGGIGKDDDAAERAVVKADLADLMEIAQRITGWDADTDVIWIDRGRDEDEPPRLHVAPLNVAGSIRQLMDEHSVVATSATLQLGGGFEQVARSFGMEPGSWTSTDYGSPFDYSRQGILYVAAHLPRPGRDGVSEAALDELVELVEASKGGVLGLFSSLRGAERAAEYVRTRVDVPIAVQGEDQIPTLVADFMEDPHACLFGTLSLWQGVDVPGDTCRLVVIDRIPFPRPDDPVMSARSDAAARAGRNGFMEVSAAHAALLLAQGAGRLIRRSEDQGIVAILDSRVATAGYGSFLVRSLPPFWPTRDGVVARKSLAALADGIEPTP